MSTTFSLTVTTLQDALLVSSEVVVKSWIQIESVIAQYPSAPACFSLSEHRGPQLMFLMLEAERAHLSVREPADRCHYLTSDGALDQFVDIGWDCFPAWLVTVGRAEVLRVAKLFVERRELADWVHWHA